jgi:hypothetical protein
MKESFVADLWPRTFADITFPVHARELRTSRNGSAYLEVRLGDCTGSIRAILQDGDWTARNPALHRELFKTQANRDDRAEAPGERK